MKSAPWLTLVLALAASALPAAAQEQTDTLGSFGLHDPATEATPGPLSRTITRERIRLALAPHGGSADAEWSRVRTVEPGREITVTIRGSQAAKRYFVSADDVGLTVLNLTDPTLPAAAARWLREIALQHREYFGRAAKGETFLLDNLRLTSAGVLVAHRKVADLQHVVETGARKEVAEIRTRQKGRGVWGHLGPVGGYFIGAMSGGVVAGLVCQAAVGRDRCDSGAFLTGGLVGGIAGGVYGFRAGNRETVDVVYRAP
jgi:hypothetical protein